MANCIPPPDLAVSTSDAELRFLKALNDQLSSEFAVLHSVAWISKPSARGALDGEADILIAHPRFGVLVIEVKGGRISLDYPNRRWTSTDRHGAEHQIKNPFDQAKRSKFGILEKLKEHPGWQRLRVRRFNIGHAAFFPDIGDGGRLRGPDAPQAIIGDQGDIKSLANWVARAFEHWRGTSEDGLDEIGTSGVEMVASIFARIATTRPLLSARIKSEEEQRIQLTQAQAAILDMLQRQRRALIAGGAGTGKTLIAREKAVRLASEGMRTLLICFNRGLADHLREQCKGVSQLDVATFHQVCHHWIARAKADLGRDFLAEAKRDHPRADEFNQLMPLALANAIDVLGPAYDAIVVDEGQDFGDEFWMPIEMLLASLEQGIFYVFLDENQDIYRRSAQIPVRSEPMVLDRNCRNTGAIHEAAYRHYRGALVKPSGIDGVAVEAIHANGAERQIQSIVTLASKLITQEGIAAHNICVLICDGREKSHFERLLASSPLPKAAKLGRLEDYGTNVLTVDTVARFKGLERDVVVLCGFDSCSTERDRETLYVGMSRAKALLCLCGSGKAIERLTR
ncbi:MAG: NERD domain-containing protein [Rhizomicrobium sp.]